MSSSTYPVLYRGSVKDLLGPVQTPSGPGLIFEYTDSYSVFDWGRMPDPLPSKGEALAVIAAHLFEKLERPESWQDFSKTKEALSVRRGSRMGSAFNELGERLQKQGLRTHFKGLLGPKQMLVHQVSAVKPKSATILGRAVSDYSETRISPLPRLIPLEVIFRFSCPQGSSLVTRLKENPQYLIERGFVDTGVDENKRWDFPVLELFTKLESSDRPLGLGEALAISGASADQFREMLMKSAWVAGFVKAQLSPLGLELADGKLEWAIAENGEVMLVDAIGPDELRILKGGVQLSKEFLRLHYRTTPWYQAIQKAKEQAASQGVSEWKKLVPLPPTPLPPAQRDLAVQVYLALANSLTGRSCFPNAWPLSRVTEELQKMSGALS